ncbi:hypothetical protein ACFL09_04575 [Planctomycetota bacterium]
MGLAPDVREHRSLARIVLVVLVVGFLRPSTGMICGTDYPRRGGEAPQVLTGSPHLHSPEEEVDDDDENE